MAKDDYFVIVYKILSYLYVKLKSGEDTNPNMITHDSQLLQINRKYWDYIMRNLIEDGYITCETEKVWGKRFKRLQPGLHPRRSLSRMGNSCAGIFRKGGRQSLIYRNKRTGNVIETQCELKGGDWEAEKPPRSTTKKRKTVKKDE